MNAVMRNWVGIVGVCLVFTLGMISGAALTVRLARGRVERLILSGQADSTITDRITNRLSGRLNCDAQQREQIRAILRDAHRDLRQARQQIAPQLRAVFGQTAEHIRVILHQDQTKTFDEMIARARAHPSLANFVPPASGVPPPPMGAGSSPAGH